MLRKALVLATVCAAALGTAGQALAGNVADNSTGTVQVGATTVNPTAAVAQDTTTASLSAPVTIGSGDNTATNSTGTVQTGSVSATPSASGSAQDNNAAASAPVSVTGGVSPATATAAPQSPAASPATRPGQTLGVSKTLRAAGVLGQQLPFTGLALWLFAAVGLRYSEAACECGATPARSA